MHYERQKNASVCNVPGINPVIRYSQKTNASLLPKNAIKYFLLVLGSLYFFFFFWRELHIYK